MALWGISTTSETADNNYAIPKYQESVDRNRSPWNTFADVRGWIQRWYGTTENSGLSTNYYDEVLISVAGLNTGPAAGISSDATGLCIATPVAVFFEDPNKASPITIGGGATTGITTGTTGHVHVVWNETVYAGAGSTVIIKTFDANGQNENTAIVATAASVASGAGVPIYTNEDGYVIVDNFNGQITNRVSFAFTAPTSVLAANVTFLTTDINASVAAGGTNIFVSNTTEVVAGVSSISIAGVAVTNQTIVSVGTTFVQIGTGSTVDSVIGIGTVVTFSTRTNKTKLVLDLTAGVVGIITDFSGGAAVTKTLSGLLYNVGGAGTTGSVGIATDMLNVTA